MERAEDLCLVLGVSSQVPSCLQCFFLNGFTQVFVVFPKFVFFISSLLLLHLFSFIIVGYSNYRHLQQQFYDSNQNKVVRGTWLRRLSPACISVTRPSFSYSFLSYFLICYLYFFFFSFLFPPPQACHLLATYHSYFLFPYSIIKCSCSSL